MQNAEGPRPMLRVLASQIDLEDVSGRVLFPTPNQGPWLPFLRFAETSTSRRGDQGEVHSHQGEEVLNYVLAGQVEYEDDVGQRTILGSGAVSLLTALDMGHHNLMARPPPPARWISVVVQCPVSAAGSPHMVQLARGPLPTRSESVTVDRHLVGRGGAVASSAGLDCREIEFRSSGHFAAHIGSGRRAVAYVFDGSGSVDGIEVGPAAGALLESGRDVELRGAAGTRILLASLPTRGAASPRGM